MQPKPILAWAQVPQRVTSFAQYPALLTADFRRDFPPFCLFILLQTRLKLSSIPLYLLFYPSEVDRRKKTERYCHLSVKTMLL
jgi:hypothetical protein